MLPETHPLCEAEAFLLAWFEAADPEHFIEFCAMLPKEDARHGKESPTHTYACRVRNLEKSFDTAIADWIRQKNIQRREIYYGVCPRAEMAHNEKGGVRPAKAPQVTHAVGAWADVDSPRWKQYIDESKPPATFVISSGGGAQLLFRYSQAVPVERAIEDSKALARQHGGDDVWNSNRYLRVPGTTNWKKWWSEYKLGRPCTIYLADPERTYGGTPEGATAARKVGDISDLNYDLKQVIKDGHDSGGCLLLGRGEEGKVNRSQVDYHVMVELILRGWAKDQIFAVFKSPDFGISAKYFEEGGNGEHYLKATYDSAAAKAATEITQWGLIGDVLDFQSAQDLAKAPDLTFAVESLVPTGGMMILSGASKAGKSMLVSDLMLLLAGCKGKFLEHFDVLTPGPVVYCQAEIGQPSLKKRLNLIAHSRKVVWSQLPIHFFHGPFRLDFDLHLSSLRKGLEKVKAKYLIVDPLARYHLSNENSQMDMARVLRNFENVGKDAGLAGLILVHHHGKPSGDSPREGAHKTRGHSIIGDWANSHVVLNKLWSDSAQRKYIRILFELRDADEPDPMTLQLDRKQLRFVKFSENDEKLGIALTIVKANGRIPEKGKERREVVEEISEKLGTSLKTAEAFLGRASRVFQDGTGDNLPDEPGSGG